MSGFETPLDGSGVELAAVVCRLLGVFGVGVVGGIIWTRNLARNVCQKPVFDPACAQVGTQTEHAVLAVAAVAAVLLVVGAVIDRG